MARRKSKRDSKGNLTRCPHCGKAVRGQKGLKAHLMVCEKAPANASRKDAA